ncbi:GDNF family receptor alpha-like [Toxotes jaculatrix]|uniref:GDNF family receptor alpha-like n=1 Tax=Toxotes jaculatrix TaxID=941984 RepID=UPI001B3A8D78|nr:GDNF family receptor alpha-like [Toxotes jaculatrix]
MKLTRLEAAVVLGIVIPQISSISVSSAPSDCLTAVDTCMSDLCESEQAFYDGICNNEGCQIKGSEVCNMTIQTVLDQFPFLRGCVCAWEEELCDSLQALATQCHRKPAHQLKRSTVTDCKSSSLIGYVYDGAGSCFDQMRVCVNDAVCNRHLAPVLQACMADQCDRDRCQQETRHFYGSMPQNVAEMLAMCECEASDQYCLQMKTALHSGTCEDETWICQVSVNQCADDSNCRDLLKTFQAKCWSPEEAQCSNSDLHSNECFNKIDPAFILGAESECKMAFLATLGTALHHPCSCEGLHSEDLHTCNMIHDVLHNRSHFMTSSKSSSGPSKPPKISDSEHGHTWSHDYLLYVFATVLFVGVVILMPLAVVTKIWMTRKRDKTKYHNPQKSNCVVIL